jgi:chromosome segregation ATPase
LNGAALEKFKEYCRFLRSEGFGNQSIAKTTGYALPTIKEYTRGVKATKTPAMAAIVELLSQMVDNDVTIDDVQRYLTVDKWLAQKGTSADKVATFMAKLDEAKMDVRGAATLDSQIKSLRGNGISAEQILALVQQLSQLGQMGISTKNINTIADAAKKYGQVDKVIQAINSYGGIADIQKESAEKNAALSATEKKIEDAKAQVHSLETKKRAAQQALDQYEKLQALGYNHEILREIVEASSKLGEPSYVFRALKKESYIRDVAEAIKQGERKNASVEASIKELEARYVHLQPVIKLCEELLYKHGFNVHAIEDLYKVAKKYGNPF